MTSNPFGGIQDLVGQLPELVQPLLVAAVGAVPFIDEAASGLGVVAGMHPVVAFSANVVGSAIAVVLVVLLGSRGREAVVARRARRSASTRTSASVAAGSPTTAASSSAAGSSSAAVSGSASDAPATTDELAAPAKPVKPESKGRQRLSRWLVRFGVPGASLLAPLALPFSFTALFFVGAGVDKRWVIVWQLVSIVLWTAVVTISATAALAVLTR